jgi:hypothetical protein
LILWNYWKEDYQGRNYPVGTRNIGNKIQQKTTIRKKMNSKKLTARQLKAIPHIKGSPTYTEGCKKAKLDRATFYKWLKEPDFKAELDRQRDEIAAEAFRILSQSLTKAVETLVSFLDNKDDRLNRLASKDVIKYIIKYKEIEDLDKRLAVIEQRLSELK